MRINRVAKVGVVGGIVAAWSQLAAAAPVGLCWTLSDAFVGGQQYTIGRLYVYFDDPRDVLLEVFDVDIQLTGATCNHNDLTTLGQDAPNGSWNPNDFLVPVAGNPAIDSFVTIGGGPSNIVSNANSTGFAPDFAGTPSSLAGGWFNADPSNLQGAGEAFPGVPGTCALVAQIAIVGGPCPSANLSVSLTAVADQGLGTPQYPPAELSALLTYGCPAPGAAGLLALAAGTGVRRRRRG